TSYLEKVKKASRKQIKQSIIPNHFGEFDDKDYRATIQELIDSGKLVAEHGKKRINDEVLLTYLG
ncbi:MAG TPA: hypothetical protein VGB02_05445, partial [Pyrinomonadaceae bacterium]